jgi:hypothetical protein
MVFCDKVLLYERSRLDKVQGPTIIKEWKLVMCSNIDGMVIIIIKTYNLIYWIFNQSNQYEYI